MQPDIEHFRQYDDERIQFTIMAYRQLTDEEVDSIIRYYCSTNKVNSDRHYTIMSVIGAPGT
jgi:hypothetical protein